MPSLLLNLAKERGHQVHEMVVSSAVELIFREIATFTSPHAKAMTREVNRGSQGSRVLAKERVRM